MAENTYNEILTRVRGLKPQDQARLLDELSARVGLQRAAGVRRHIQELRGLGKTIWKGVDPDEYVQRERTSWNG
jgi:hypothetical protein